MSHVAFAYGRNSYVLKTWAPADHVHRELAAKSTFLDAPVLEFIRSRNLRGVYVDIGAGIGNYSVYFANECVPALVVTIEGNPAMASLLSENIRRNRHRDVPVWLLPSFITDRPKVYFNRARGDNIGSSFLSEVPIAESSEAVPGLCLDEICHHLPRVDLLVIDAENHELEVLKSAIQLLRVRRPEVCIRTDWHSYQLVGKYVSVLGYILIESFNDSVWYFVPAARPLVLLDKKLLEMPKAIRSRARWRLHWSISAWQRLIRRRHRPPIADILPQGMIQI